MPGYDPIGFVCAGVSILCFGSNFVVTKKYKSGDGIFFQWVMCSAIWMVGLIAYLAQCSMHGVCAQFEPLAMLGGAIWACGNILTVPIVKTIGLGIGLLTWGLVNLVMGWATGRFGLFGITAQPVSEPVLNDFGVVVAACALVVFLFIKTDVKGSAGSGKKAAGEDDEDGDGFYNQAELGLKPLINGGSLQEGEAAGSGEQEEKSWTDNLSPIQKKLFGFGASAVAGFFYGCNFSPPQYIVDHPDQYPGASTELADYIFPHFCGIFMTSTFFLLAYCALKRNAPVLFPEIVLPGWVSGGIWATAQCCWFVANAKLSLVVAFPLINLGPGLVGALWGIYFGELRGKKNYMLLAGAFVLIAGAATMIVVSK